MRFKRDQLIFFDREEATDPTSSNDSTEDLEAGALWYNTTRKTIWVLRDPTAGAAQWVLAFFDPKTVLVASGDVVTSGGDVVTVTPAPLAPYP